ncbi:type II toxin-antitoxin system HicB family antitoxin [Bremerella cremea]|uniref:Type II toxin-antitoxin system HicB family antitoxin n=1 Tax=Bremerella cremea TaxID=1031537 RepID=A0A368KPT8_9BACT|nr:type II toxin-antitoxin system HicB family antitoxin [Bremerella cremea]RCS43926.1 type II toxin-antitoxin system HicB family antitoxin [Bremerella cremea]
MFQYKGYLGRVEIDEEAGLLHGQVINTQDVITFQGESVEETKQAFHDSVDEYLKFCADHGKEPDKPFSGQFVTRISPDLHRAASAQAAIEKMSLNAWVESLVRQGVETQSKRPTKRSKASKASSAKQVTRPAKNKVAK